MKNTIKFIFVVVLVALFMFSLVACNNNDSSVLDNSKEPKEEKAVNNDQVTTGKEITVTADSFQEDVINSKGIMLVDFWADWCGPCVALAPILEEVSAETGITIAKINVDENPDLASVFEIQGIPAVFIIVDGQPESKIIGINPKESYLKAIDSYR